MTQFSRRKMMASLAMASGSLLSLGSKGSAEPRGGKPVVARDDEPRMTPSARKADRDSLVAYLGVNAPKLLRPAGTLRYPSISGVLPGATYDTELWDWDTLWTCQGLFRLARLMGDGDLHRKIGEHAQGSLLNFLDHQSDEGRIPIMINGKNEDFFGSLKKVRPKKNNQAKPVFGQLALLISDEVGDARWFSPWFDRLVRFYDSWLVENRAKIGLFVWGDDVAVGVDNDPTVFGRPLLSSAHLLLNCLFYMDLKAAAEVAHRLQRLEDEKRLAALAQELGENLRKYCWDPRDRFYYTVDVQCVDDRAEMIPSSAPLGMDMSWQCLPLRIQTFGGFLPMWCGLATREQAQYLVKQHFLNDETFHAAWGVRTLSKQETMFSLVRSGNPSNWLGPVWILANYFVWKGLKDYGFESEANVLGDKTLRLLAMDLAKSGSMNEYYHPDTGAPLSVRGFLDWNMLALEMV